MSFDTDRATLVQEHFIIFEIDLPELRDECALPDGGGTGYGTPRSCSQTWNETDFKTYYFGTENTPLEYGRPRTSAGLPADVIEMPDNVYRIIKAYSDTPAEIKPGQGLAARLSLRLTLKDFLGNPGPREGAYLSDEGTLTLVVGDSVVVQPGHAAGGDEGHEYKSITVTGSTNLSTQDYSNATNWEDLGVFTPKDTGTFFGKLAARNVVANKTCRVKFFYTQPDGVYAESDAQLRTYTLKSLRDNGDGTWIIAAADELTKLDPDKSQFPEPTGGTVRGTINATTANFTVDAVTDWEQMPRPYIVRSGGELMKVNSVSNNQTASARLNLATRGADIVFTQFITETTAEAHDDGDEVQICHTDDNEDVAFMLAQLMLDARLSGGMYGTTEGTVTLVLTDTVEVEAGHVAGGTIGRAYRSITVTGSTDLTLQDYSNATNWEDLGVAVWSISQWRDETDTWLAGVSLETVWHEPTTTNDVLQRILTNYLIDMWYDPIDALIKITAISVWKASSITLEVGKHINRDTLRITEFDQRRNTRAFIHYNKRNKIEDDEIKHYKQIAVHINTALEAPGLYGKPKTKQFPNSAILDSTRAALLVQRWVGRFGEMPLVYRWTTEEKFLDFSTGDVVDIVGDEVQGFDGSQRTVRAQVLSVQAIWGKTGRTYNVKAMTYEPAADDGTAFTITGPATNINLYVQAGAPSTAVTITFLLDSGIFGSTDTAVAAIVAGAFPSGSHIDLVLQNGADLQAAGGRGGRGESNFYDSELETWLPIKPAGDGGDGGIVYDAQGVDTDIYLSKTFDGNAANGTLRAPGGGGGGEDAVSNVAGDGGGGGAGSSVGAGGPGGTFSGVGVPPGVDGADGADGTTTGTGGTASAGAGAGGDWGEDGIAGDTTAGLKGDGIADGGATVQIFVATYFLSSSGVQSIVPGDSVEVAGGHVAGGVVGDVYKSLITDAARNLAAEDYTVGANWSRQYAQGGGDTPSAISA